VFQLDDTDSLCFLCEPGSGRPIRGSLSNHRMVAHEKKTWAYTCEQCSFADVVPSSMCDHYRLRHDATITISYVKTVLFCDGIDAYEKLQYCRDCGHRTISHNEMIRHKQNKRNCATRSSSIPPSTPSVDLDPKPYLRPASSSSRTPLLPTPFADAAIRGSTTRSNEDDDMARIPPPPSPRSPTRNGIPTRTREIRVTYSTLLPVCPCLAYVHLNRRLLQLRACPLLEQDASDTRAVDTAAMITTKD